MIGLPWLQSLFAAILQESSVIDGRFYTCPFFGAELNKGLIDEIVEFAVPKQGTDQKYPCAILLPFRSTGYFQYSGLDASGIAAAEKWDLSMVFCGNAYTTGQGQVSSPNPVTGKTTHTIPDMWHDMARVAKNFEQVLYEVIQNTPELIGQVWIGEGERQERLQVTCKGNDAVTGVYVRIPIYFYPGCGIEDYPSDYLQRIQIPPIVDTHPLHTDI
jgi:hypothetical protein